MINTPNTTMIGDFLSFAKVSQVGLSSRTVVTDDEMKALFTGGKQGVFYNILPAHLWQNTARTIPVTANGDPVGCIDDLSGNGNHATQSVSAARPIYKTDGILHWLEPDGVDDVLLFNKNAFNADKSLNIFTAYNLINTGGLFAIILGSYPVDKGLEVFHDSFTRNRRFLLATTTNPRVAASGGNVAGNTNVVRATRWKRSEGVIVDTLNSKEAFSGTLAANEIMIQPTSYHSLGGSQGYLSNHKLYGVIAISDDISDAMVTKVEQYLAAKAGVAL